MEISHRWLWNRLVLCCVFAVFDWSCPVLLLPPSLLLVLSCTSWPGWWASSPTTWCPSSASSCPGSAWPIQCCARESTASSRSAVSKTARARLMSGWPRWRCVVVAGHGGDLFDFFFCYFVNNCSFVHFWLILCFYLYILFYVLCTFPVCENILGQLKNSDSDCLSLRCGSADVVWEAVCLAAVCGEVLHLPCSGAQLLDHRGPCCGTQLRQDHNLVSSSTLTAISHLKQKQYWLAGLVSPLHGAVHLPLPTTAPAASHWPAQLFEFIHFLDMRWCPCS